MWLAHAMTLSRIPLAIALWEMWGDAAWSVALVVLAGITDMADGRIARWAKRHGRGGPDIGGWLDPAVDKLFVAIVLAAIWVHTGALAAIALVGARELVLVPLTAIYLARRAPHRPLRADRLGKLATVAQFIALCVMALAPGRALVVAAAAGALGLVAAGHYVAVAVGEAHVERRGHAGRDTPRA
ncbi:MAG TPA: CDP-alcohol phosphatidyltransferase family protein [Kofleriaceae bacterium]|nr:CDP-alcohol phosphatidyltransferase family protein [Kofleriaceae bacterium]